MYVLESKLIAICGPTTGLTEKRIVPKDSFRLGEFRKSPSTSRHPTTGKSTAVNVPSSNSARIPKSRNKLATAPIWSCTDAI
jgi:hypothetical protein